MSDILISAEGLGKKYLIGHKATRERYTALRDVLARGAKSFLRKASDLAHGRAVIEGDELEEVWALRDVSFEVKRGEVLGIIGRNGAGKSTLLKVLSRITEPSAGRVTLRGRIASLLEVGTGFHPELTGRENIFLNGAILGMTRGEIRRRFDEIVAFAEIEKFLDTPVKRFSSGMYVRLAFAVAAHLDPEILVVDEVLAIGDLEFQRKCLGKMRQVSCELGRTVLLVSHNMSSIRSLAQRAILLEDGRLSLEAPVEEAIDYYLKRSSVSVSAGIFERTVVRPTGKPFFVRRVVTSALPDEMPVARFDCDRSFQIRVSYELTRRVPGLFGCLVLQRPDGTIVFESDSFDAGENPLESLAVGCGEIRVSVPPRTLGPGVFQICLSFSSWTDDAGPDVDSVGVCGAFEIDDSRTKRGNRRNGHLATILRWECLDSSSLVLDRPEQ